MAVGVVAVVPTFQPGVQLRARVESLRAQVDHVVISDDASPCTSDGTLRDLEGIADITVIRHASNRGIARGLNDGLAHALREGASWLLTVDQDSDLAHGYVAALLRDSEGRSGIPIGAIGAEVIIDASGTLGYPIRASIYGQVTEELIQTGTLWSVRALHDVGGFDERLGIDAVDAAACLRLRERGFAICVAPRTVVHHAIGTSRIVRLAGRDVMVTGHSPERRTTMMRNRLQLFPAEFKQSPRHAVRTLRRVTVNQVLGVVLERDKWHKARASVRGLMPSRDPGDR